MILFRLTLLILSILSIDQIHGFIIKGESGTLATIASQIDSSTSVGQNTTYWRIKPELKRDARTKCSMPGFLAAVGPGAPQSKRNAHDLKSIPSTSLERLFGRTMSLPGGDMKEFYDNEFVSQKFEPIVWQDLDEDDPESEDFCSALFEKVGTAQAKSLGVHGICGCTVLVVVSRTGVYMGHYWENMVFHPDDEFLVGTTEADLFNDFVIKGLRDGVPKPRGVPKWVRPRQESLLSKVPELLKGDPTGQHLKAYLIHPSGSDDDNPVTYANYVAKWAEMRNTVGQMFPGTPLAILAGGIPGMGWTDISYTPLNNDDTALKSTAAGKVLFKYDPDHEGKKKAALWIEGDLTDRHHDEWT